MSWSCTASTTAPRSIDPADNTPPTSRPAAPGNAGCCVDHVESREPVRLFVLLGSGPGDEGGLGAHWAEHGHRGGAWRRGYATAYRTSVPARALRALREGLAYTRDDVAGLVERGSGAVVERGGSIEVAIHRPRLILPPSRTLRYRSYPLRQRHPTRHHHVQTASVPRSARTRSNAAQPPARPWRAPKRCDTPEPRSNSRAKH